MTEQRPSPTLIDVANLSGYSTATVSRCLNFPDRVSKSTRKKVTEAIDALGYTPNFGARAMAAQRTNTIGAIIPTMENAVFARGIQAFQEELGELGYHLLVASSSYKPDLEEQLVRSLVARGADAILLIGHERQQAIYDYLDTRRVPTLISWAFDSAFSRPSVGFNNRNSMRNMAREVLELGHRKLAVISAHVAGNDRAKARLEGVKDAMREAGHDAAALAVIETDFGIESGAIAFRSLFESADRPTAVICGNDVLAVGAIGQARAMGLSVPGNVSITGFDDIELAQVAFPKLSTVHVPHRDMGRAAARALVKSIQTGRAITPLELATELTLRDSLGPVPTS